MCVILVIMNGETIKGLFRRFAGLLQLAFVVAVVGAAVMLSASLKPDRGDARPRAAVDRIAVSVVEPTTAAYAPRLKLNGVVEARTVTSIVPQVDGRVIEVSSSFRPGAAVERGEVLFAIEPADYELAVDRTLADIEMARSELAQLEAEAAAEREVWASSFPNREIPDLIARRPQIAAAKGRLHSAQAARAGAELALSRTVVRAPFDARILDTELDLGQVVSSAAPVGSMFSTASLEIAVPVSADELQRIGPVYGRIAAVTTPTGEIVEGTVVRKAAALDERTRLRTLFIASDNSSGLTLGEFVSVEIEGFAIEQAFRLPPGALTSRDRLWVVDGDQLFDREIELLGREGETLVVSTFDTADGVVAIPPPDVRIGMPVQPVVDNEFAGTGGVAGAAK